MSPVARATVAYIVYFTAVGAYWPYIPVYYRGLGLDLGTIGLLAALAAATQLVASPAWGALTDRFPHSRLILPAAAFLAAGAAVGLASARDLPVIAACVLLLALGLSGVSPMLDARTLDLLGEARHRYGQVRAWGSVAFIVTALLVGFLIDRQGNAILFAIYVPGLVLTALVTFSFPRRRRTRSVSPLRGAWDLFRQRSMGFFLLGALLTWMMITAVNAFFSIHLIALGAPAQAVGLAWIVGAAVEVPLMWAFPRLAARFGMERLLIAAAFAFVLREIGYALVADPAVLVALTALEGFGFGLFYVGGVTFVSQRAPAGLAGTAQGVFTGISAGLATILGTGLGGFVAGALTIRGLFAVCAVGSAIATVVVAYAVLSERRPVAGAASAPIDLLNEEVPS